MDLSVSPQRVIAVFGSAYQNDWVERIAELFDMIRSEALRRGISCRVMVDAEFFDYLKSQGVQIGRRMLSFPPDASVSVSFGGDGTLLRAFCRAAQCDVPIVGVNTGRLGYLAGFSLADMPQAAAAILLDEFDSSPRMLLEADSELLPPMHWPCALNEISIQKGSTTSMLSVKAYMDGVFLADIMGDGVVISTPTGSTAYNLSIGGPILQPTLKNIILTPISPHSLTMRPMVLSADSKLRFQLSTRGADCHIGIDGRTYTLPDGAELRVHRAPLLANVAQPRGVHFVEVLRDKLNWGK